MNIWLGFPLCFYNGMTELWKIGFSLLFPLYLLTIVVAHMILSHCCVRNSNRIPHSSVQIFVTVIYISPFQNWYKLLLMSLYYLTFTLQTQFTMFGIVMVSKIWCRLVSHFNDHHITILVIPLVLPFVLCSSLLEQVNIQSKWICSTSTRRKRILVCSFIFFVSEYMYCLYILQSSKLFYNVCNNNTNNDIILTFTSLYFKLIKSTLVSILNYSMIFNLIFMFMTTRSFLLIVKIQ